MNFFFFGAEKVWVWVCSRACSCVCKGVRDDLNLLYSRAATPETKKEKNSNCFSQDCQRRGGGRGARGGERGGDRARLRPAAPDGHPAGVTPRGAEDGRRASVGTSGASRRRPRPSPSGTWRPARVARPGRRGGSGRPAAGWRRASPLRPGCARDATDFVACPGPGSATGRRAASPTPRPAGRASGHPSCWPGGWSGSPCPRRPAVRGGVPLGGPRRSGGAFGGGARPGCSRARRDCPHARRRAGRRAPPGPGDVRGGVRLPRRRSAAPATRQASRPRDLAEVAGASAVGGGGGPSTPPWGAGAGAAVRARRGGGGVVPRQPRPAGHLGGWVLGAGLRPPSPGASAGRPARPSASGCRVRCTRRGAPSRVG